MPPRKAAAKSAAKNSSSKKAATKKPAAKKSAAPKPVGKIEITKRVAPKKAAASAKTEKAAKTAKSAAPRTPVQKTRVVTAGAAAPRTKTRVPVEKTRVVIALDFYEPHKDAIKAPFKEHALKWNFLGEGKGLYKREDGSVHCFTQFKDDGVHYSIWGADKEVCEKILATWRKILGEEGWLKATTSGEQEVEAEKAHEVSEATRLWRLAEPQRRPGEPDLFYSKRVAEWQAKKPA